MVIGEREAWSYLFPIRQAGQSRAQPGKGINENYLAFGYSNADGADFQLDQIEVPLIESKQRRVGA